MTGTSLIRFSLLILSGGGSSPDEERWGQGWLAEQLREPAERLGESAPRELDARLTEAREAGPSGLSSAPSATPASTFSVLGDANHHKKDQTFKDFLTFVTKDTKRIESSEIPESSGHADTHWLATLSRLSGKGWVGGAQQQDSRIMDFATCDVFEIFDYLKKYQNYQAAIDGKAFVTFIKKFGRRLIWISIPSIKKYHRRF